MLASNCHLGDGFLFAERTTPAAIENNKMGGKDAYKGRLVTWATIFVTCISLVWEF